MGKQNKVIDFKNILAHLPANKIKELETITQRIIDTDKIYQQDLIGDKLLTSKIIYGINVFDASYIQNT